MSEITENGSPIDSNRFCGSNNTALMRSEDNLMMNAEEYKKIVLFQRYLNKPIVRAAGPIGKDSSTEIIDVKKLSQNSATGIQYVEIIDAEGRLICLNKLVTTPCWLKIIEFANDCQACNVLLMTTAEGVILKTIRDITPGEPLLMWFTEYILAMLNIPFLSPCNIQDQTRYICHICNNLFEFPNPLKIHLALKCNRLDNSHLWTLLSKEFNMSPRPSLSLNLFPNPTFKFELTKLPQAPPARVSPITIKTIDNTAQLGNSNPSKCSDRPSPSSSNALSFNSSSTQISPSISTREPSITKDTLHRQSAFQPYSNQSNFLKKIYPLTKNETVLTPYNMQTTAAPISTDVHAAQVETIVSNLGKSKQGHLCIYCGKVYSRKYGLKIHIRTHTGYKPLKCKYCLRPFGDPSNLNKHVRLHSEGETPYRCDLCGKVLVRRRDLERHLKSRHQENIIDSTDTSSDGADV
ncbi:PR domain zinc finger protein 13 [Bombus impatiens]|uniref:PR domain zinc finger protein 13 n=1 Tax=Bombus impatiens TaxID=132113 RepID=A0A6P3V115_BOMIM|nr:PR domain zinc finger protein 13 [Bombus impatiens]